MDTTEHIRALLRAGRRGPAERAARTWAAAHPDRAEGPRLLAEIYQASGRAREALLARAEAARRAPDSAPDQAALGALLVAVGQAAAALPPLRRAVALAPDAPGPRALLARAARAAGQTGPARAHLVAQAPRARRPAELWVEAAELAWEDADLEAADRCLDAALAAAPGHGAAHLFRAVVLAAAGHLDRARPHAEAARAALPDHPEPARVLAEVAEREGDIAGARALLEEAAARAPGDPRLQWARLVSLDAVQPSAEAERAAQDRVTALLPTLEAAAATLPAHPARWVEAIRTAFPLHYLGGDRLEEQRRLGALAARAMAAAHPGPLPPRPPRARLRVGFVSSSFRRHTVTKLFGGWLRHLDRSRFEVVGFDVGLHADAETAELADRCDRYLRPVGGLPGVLRAIRADAPDALIFPEVGMDARVMKVAACRLAPLQAAAWGHPVTTGLPTVDVFLSSAAMAVQPDRTWTTEERVDLPGLGVCYPRPARPEGASRAALGLPEDRPLALCVQSLFKYRPWTDDLHARIAEGAPAALLVFLEDPRGPVTRTFRSRLQAAFARRGLELDRHVRILPRLPEADWMRLLAVGDLFLDSPGWSGGNTTLEALAVDLPCLAFPGETMRGRHSLGMMRALGLDALVARDADDWVGRAVRLLADPDARAALRGEIAARADRLYDDRRSVRALEELLLARCAQPAG